MSFSPLAPIGVRRPVAAKPAPKKAPVKPQPKRREQPQAPRQGR